MIAFSYGRITRATVARNPVAKGVLLPLKLTGLGLFLFKLRLHVFKPFLFSTASKKFPTQRRVEFRQPGSVLLAALWASADFFVVEGLWRIHRAKMRSSKNHISTAIFN